MAESMNFNATAESIDPHLMVPKDDRLGEGEIVAEGVEIVVPLSEISHSTISKNQLKRMRKAEKWAEIKILKKAKEKERKRELKCARSAQVKGFSEPELSLNRNSVEGVVTEVSANHVWMGAPPTRSHLKEQEKRDYIQRMSGRFAIIIDCNWENLQSERQLKSLSQQISFLYGLNRKHSHPAKLFVTGLAENGQLSNSLRKMNCHSWVGVTISNKDYVDLPDFTISDTSNSEEPASAHRKRIVYLTSDATDTLTTLDDSCAYVIGGMVDRNRHKGATFNKAITQGVATAKLPIREHLAMAGTHILTVNHVHQILLDFAASGSWEQAVVGTIPLRKIAGTDCQGSDDEIDERVIGDNPTVADGETQLEQKGASPTEPDPRAACDIGDPRGRTEAHS